MVGQVAVFTLGTGGAGLVRAAAMGILASSLSVAAFGAFSLAVAVLQYGALLFEFGLFLPAGRLAALARGDERRAIVGSALALYVPVGVAFAAVVFASSFAVDDWFTLGIGHSLRVVAPIAALYPFTYIGLQLAQGIDRVNFYSASALLAQVVFLSVVAALLATGHLGETSALVGQCTGVAIGGLVLATALRPRLVQLANHARTLVVQAREYGFRVYVGRVLSLGTYNMDVLMLGILADARQVAVYTLAGLISIAIGLPVTGLTTVLFSRMAATEEIDRRWLRLAWLLGAAAVPAAWVIAELAVHLVLPHAYGALPGLTVIMTMAQVLRGVTSVYNTFLSSHARGRELRTAGLVLTLSNVVLNFALIPPFGATGAAWASFLALLANLGVHVQGYRTALRRA